jgi:hypothetical protein
MLLLLLLLLLLILLVLLSTLDGESCVSVNPGTNELDMSGSGSGVDARDRGIVAMCDFVMPKVVVVHNE